MRVLVLVMGGLLVAVAGVVFTLQGVGLVGGSVMSGSTFWVVAGPLIAIAGLATTVVGLRRRSVLLRRGGR